MAKQLRTDWYCSSINETIAISLTHTHTHTHALHSLNIPTFCVHFSMGVADAVV